MNHTFFGKGSKKRLALVLECVRLKSYEYNRIVRNVIDHHNMPLRLGGYFHVIVLGEGRIHCPKE